MTDELDMDAPFAAVASREGRAVTKTVSGELDIATVPELENAVPALAVGERLVLDLRNLAFIDSSGIRLLMGLDIRSRVDGWSLAIVRREGAVQRVLDLCRIPERVRTVDDPADVA